MDKAPAASLPCRRRCTAKAACVAAQGQLVVVAAAARAALLPCLSLLLLQTVCCGQTYREAGEHKRPVGGCVSLSPQPPSAEELEVLYSHNLCENNLVRQDMHCYFFPEISMPAAAAFCTVSSKHC